MTVLEERELIAWAKRKLRERGLTKDDPVTWMVEYVEGKRPGRASETNTVEMSGDPFDALASGEMYAESRYGPESRVGIGRWKAEWPGEEGTTPDYIVVVPHDDPEGGLPLTACLP